MLERVVDGDTLVCLVELGLDILKRQRVRLAGVDAPETRSRIAREKAMGAEARQRLQDLLGPPGARLRLIVVAGVGADDKFGRLLAHVYAGDDADGDDAAVSATSVNEQLVAEGFAFSYDGTGARDGHDLDALLAQRLT